MKRIQCGIIKQRGIMKIKTFLMDNLPDYNRLVIPYHL